MLLQIEGVVTDVYQGKSAAYVTVADKDGGSVTLVDKEGFLAGVPRLTPVKITASAVGGFKNSIILKTATVNK